MYALESDARAALSGEEPAEWRIGAKEEPMPVSIAQSSTFWRRSRFPQGPRPAYSIVCYLTIAIAARLAGYQRRECVRRVRRPVG